MSSEIIIVPSLFFMIGFIVYTIVDGLRRRGRMRVCAGFNPRLLGRL
jgi:hypothetical protein